ncbi:MAG: deoxyribonuclease IV [Actinomycetia bacterium]|nr:deoxyribonuclease IV [Actinomycetes bacterium]
MRVGCHISVSQGFEAAVVRAHTLGAQCFQYFTKSPRMLRFSRKLDREDARRGRERQEALGLVSIGHAPYLVNLSAPEEDMRRASVEAVLWDLAVAAARGSYAVVVHCGKHKGAGREQGMAWMKASLAEILDRDDSGVRLLLENTAGQGTELGTTAADLLELVDGVGADRLGVCLDTQHAFAAGVLDPARPETFAPFVDAAFLARLGAIHLNDSKVAFGQRVDRHELIGQGHIGPAGMARLLREPAWQDIPFFLETPVADEAQYADEIARARELAAS